MAQAGKLEKAQAEFRRRPSKATASRAQNDQIHLKAGPRDIYLLKVWYLLVLWLICTLSLAVATDHGIVIADFEGDDYGDWTVTGKAFGTSPAHGAIAETDLLKPVGGRIKLHILVDRTSLELFGNDGLLSMSSCILPNDDNKSLAFFCRAGPARLHSLTVWAFKSIWNN